MRSPESLDPLTDRTPQIRARRPSFDVDTAWLLDEVDALRDALETERLTALRAEHLTSGDFDVLGSLVAKWTAWGASGSLSVSDAALWRQASRQLRAQLNRLRPADPARRKLAEDDDSDRDTFFDDVTH